MGVPPQEGQFATFTAAARRSTRLSVAIPITISGKDSSGRAFTEKSRTVVINKHGAKVVTFHQLDLGTEVSIENRHLGKSSRGIVVWLGDRPSPKDPVEIGVQLSQAENIWGIQIPPADWQEGPPIGPGGQRLGQATSPPMATTGQESSAPAAPVAPPEPKPLEARQAAGPARDQEQSGATVQVSQPPPRRQAEQTIEERLRLYEQRLDKLAEQIGLQGPGTSADVEPALREKTEQIQGRIQAEVESALARVQQACEQEATKATRALSEEVARHVGTALESVKAATEGHVRQLDSRSHSTLAELQRRSDALLGGFRDHLEKTISKVQEGVSKQILDRLQKAFENQREAARAFEEQRLAEIQEKLREFTLEQIEESAAELDKRTTENLELFADQLKEKQDRALKEATEHFRQTLGQMLAALQPSSLESSEHGPSGNETAPKRR